MPLFKILLVDDSPSILKSLKRSLDNPQYKIYLAPSGREALNLLGEHDIDLMITDEHMPGMSGTELLEISRKTYPDVIRIMITGLTDIEVAKKAINNGEIYRFFNKPWDDFELTISVQLAFKQKILENENYHLKGIIEKQDSQLKLLETEYPGITKKNTTEDGVYVIE